MLEKRKLSNKYDHINLFLGTYNYDVLFENEESTDTKTNSDSSPMPALEGDEEEVRKRK